MTKEEEITMAHLRTAFRTTESGRFAFRWLMNRLKLVDELRTERDTTLHNFAVEMMATGRFTLMDLLEGNVNE